MADMADTAAGRIVAETLVRTRMDAGTWIVGHMAVNMAGHTIVRFIRPLTSALTQGAWVEDRDDGAS